MLDLSNLNTVRGLLARHGIKPRKALGQNFIVNSGVCPKIADLGGAAPGVGALEIGPGIGVLTAQLALRCQKVVAVELNSGLIPVLGETLKDFDNVTVIHGDILKLDLATLIKEHFGGIPVIVCANLPYYITTPVLMALLEKKLPLVSITVMMQKETARRISAPMPSRQAGAITAAVYWYCEPRLLFDVSRGSFFPAPDVDSSVAKLVLRDKAPLEVRDEALLLRVVRSAFAQRRKTAVNSISNTLGVGKEDLLDIFEKCKIDPAARGESLDMKAFARIADELVWFCANP